MIFLMYQKKRVVKSELYLEKSHFQTDRKNKGGKGEWTAQNSLLNVSSEDQTVTLAPQAHLPAKSSLQPGFYQCYYGTFSIDSFLCSEP